MADLLPVQQSFYVYSQKEIDRYNEEEQGRSDEACEWILSHNAFKEWSLASPRGVLTMYGDMGCGKTATASFVTKYLNHELSNSKTPVLAFYCKEQEITNPRVIYRSLVYQLVQRKPELITQLQEWYDDAKTEGTQLRPTDNVALLAEFLRKSVLTLKGSIFVVLDGLDECDRPSRLSLLSFSGTLFETELGSNFLFLLGRGKTFTQH